VCTRRIPLASERPFVLTRTINYTDVGKCDNISYRTRAISRILLRYNITILFRRPSRVVYTYSIILLLLLLYIPYHGRDDDLKGIYSAINNTTAAAYGADASTAEFVVL